VSNWAGDRCRFVGDIKYKQIRAEEYPNADLYQLTAYAIVTGLPGGMLIYAAGPRRARSMRSSTLASDSNSSRWISGRTPS